MQGYVAVTHYDWFQHLAPRRFWDEVNFWRPSAHHNFKGEPGTPVFFKLKAPHNAIGGFGLVSSFSRLPDWLAWECFGEANGASTFREMQGRLNEIRERNGFQQDGPIPQIGCILLANAVFFPQELWVRQPSDWSPRNLTNQKYDMSTGEGLRIWQECQERLHLVQRQMFEFPVSAVAEAALAAGAERFGAPQLVRPRLGQGSFRVVVTDAYQRACAITGEHSLPVLEAAHIRPYSLEGPHETTNGVLLRADLHRLFDQGYLTITPTLQVEVSRRLKTDYENGKAYYPLHGSQIFQPTALADRPSAALLQWHNESVYRG